MSIEYWRRRSRRVIQPLRGPGATRGAVDQGQMETETGDDAGQRALLARGMQEDIDKEQIPLERLRALNA